MAEAESMLYIAVDFGTSFSGYCFQFQRSKQIRQPKWGAEHGYNTPKTPTCVLFDENEQFLKFGYEAEMMYASQIRNNEAKKLYLFENFKMELYGKELHRDIMLTAKNGKQMRAMKVFSESLRFMKDHALEMIGKHTSGVKFSASDATWILTVPAIWSAAAKQFMREAATEAGLVTESHPERLIIALEPEAASVWCKQLPSDGFMEGDLTEAEKIEQATGTQYMVVDCGGGTIDITVHEVLEGKRLKELHKVSGNNKGGQTVDKNYKSFLKDIFTEKVFNEFEENNPIEYVTLMNNFSVCKRCEGSTSLQCPNNLQALAEKTKSIEEYFKGKSDAEWDSGRIYLSGDKLRSLHDESLRAIEIQINEILEKNNLNMSYIFLVGGFALSPHVRMFIRDKFGKKCKVLCPVDAQLAVLKGAVTFGTMPNVVESRVSCFTYGIAVCNLFNEFKHRDKSRYVSKDGKVYCNVCFHCLVKKDELVTFNETRKHTFSPIERDQKAVRFRFFCTESKTAEFVDEQGMNNIGSMSVQMPNISMGFHRTIRLEVRFGFTEMQATATDVDSGETSSVKLDFMHK
uniref:Heat shock protein family A (Hsp70) member 12A.2 n=1 Tax=Astyanax mexicanus TaxID=7994 RepID=A0A8B9HJB5_ASTMX